MYKILRSDMTDISTYLSLLHIQRAMKSILSVETYNMHCTRNVTSTKTLPVRYNALEGAPRRLGDPATRPAVYRMTYRRIQFRLGSDTRHKEYSGAKSDTISSGGEKLFSSFLLGAHRWNDCDAEEVEIERSALCLSRASFKANIASPGRRKMEIWRDLTFLEVVY